jgi:hypothetical protein
MITFEAATGMVHSKGAVSVGRRCGLLLKKVAV